MIKTPHAKPLAPPQPKLLTPTRMQNPLCYIDFCSQDYDDGSIKYHGRLVFEVRKDITPKTAENFRALCTGEKGVSSNGQKMLHFKGNIVHRVVPAFCTQLGDITKNDGTGGEHIWFNENRRQYFDDENFILKHEKYCLAMANSGKNKNTSQFYIFHGNDSFLDGKHVVFGAVVHNFELADLLNSMGMDYEGTTARHIYVARSGVFNKQQAQSFYEYYNEQQVEKIVSTAMEL